MQNTTATADVDRAAVAQAYEDLIVDWVDRDTLELLLAADYGYNAEALARISAADLWGLALQEDLVNRQQLEAARASANDWAAANPDKEAWDERPRTRRPEESPAQQDEVSDDELEVPDWYSSQPDEAMPWFGWTPEDEHGPDRPVGVPGRPI